jgi:hypothetical protein
VADHAKDHHDGLGWSAWPSEQALANRTLLHRRNVRRILHALEAEGLIVDSGLRHSSGTRILVLPVDNLGTGGDHRTGGGTTGPLPGGTSGPAGGTSGVQGGDQVNTQGGPQAPRTSNEPPMNPQEPGASSALEGRTPGPHQVPEQVRRAVWRGTRRPPAERPTPEQLEDRRREQIAALAPIVAEELAAQERPDE